MQSFLQTKQLLQLTSLITSSQENNPRSLGAWHLSNATFSALPQYKNICSFNQLSPFDFNSLEQWDTFSLQTWASTNTASRQCRPCMTEQSSRSGTCRVWCEHCTQTTIFQSNLANHHFLTDSLFPNQPEQEHFQPRNTLWKKVSS